MTDTRLAAWLETVDCSAAVQALVAGLPDAAVFAVDAEQNLVLWSEGAERLLGFSAAEVLGQHCLKANRCPACIEDCGVRRHRRIQDAPLTLFSKTGVAVAVHKHAQALTDKAGRFLGAIEILVPETPARVAHLPPPRVSQDATGETFHGMTSVASAMHSIFQVCRNVAETNANALIRGESGTGKELVARALHAESARANGPFVPVNCAALTPTLAESELFGHIKGAFTGAVSDRAGIFEQASGGTLFLDEVAELPLPLQAKLLRVLEARTVTRVGDNRPRRVDARVVAATHRSLREMVASGTFREDLMYRLRVVPIFLPPLRERRADIEVLLWRFIRERNETGPRVVERVHPRAMRALFDHRWPGNVRELKNAVEYAFAVGRGVEMQLDELPSELRDGTSRGLGPSYFSDHAPVVATDEASRIRAALAESGGHIGRAAARLGMSRPTFWRRRQKLGL